MLETFHGTIATANAYLLVPEHHRFVGYKKDSACFQDALQSLLGVYEKQVLSADFEITESEEVVEERRVFVNLDHGSCVT